MLFMWFMILWFMVLNFIFFEIENYIYDGQFCGNIVIVARTYCAKKSFIQKLTINDFIGDFKKVEWIS